jgi:hypothetical protein
MPIKNWSPTPASNNSASPFGAPEGWAPSQANDVIRQIMGDDRTQWEGAEWFDWGDTPSRASNTTFKVAADVTTRYLAGRRIKFFDTSTLYGTVVSSSYSAPDTTVTITADSGNLSSSLSSIALGILSPTNKSIPTYNFDTVTASGAAQFQSTVTISGAVVFKTTATIEGTATLAGAAVLKSTLNVEGATTLSGAAIMKSAVTHEGTTTMSGAAVFKTTALFEGAIKGSNGFNIVTFSDAASSTDYLSINANTNNNSNIQVVSSQTNASASFLAKGSGGINVGTAGTTSTPLSIQSGSYKVLFNPTLTSDRSLTYPDSNVTLLTGAATQAEQETGSSTTTSVTPGRQQYHPSAAKCWVSFTTVTTTAIHNSYNITGLVDNGTGNTSVTIGTDFSAGNMCFVVSSYDNGAGVGAWAFVYGSVAGGSVNVATATTNTLALADSAYVTLVGYGDQ